MLTFNVLDAAARKLPGESYDSLVQERRVERRPRRQPDLRHRDGRRRASRRRGSPTQVAQTFVDEQAAVEQRQLEAARANLLEEQNRLRGTTGADSQLQAHPAAAVRAGRRASPPPAPSSASPSAPTPPEERASPKPVRNGVLAVFLGLFIGVLVALGRDQLVPRVSSQREL